MKITDFRRLKKFMMMTLSDAESERNMAIAKANEILRSYGIDWDRVLDRTVTVVNEFEPAPRENSPDEDHREMTRTINEAFDQLDHGPTMSASFFEFIESLREQWKKNGRLTPNQADALLKAAQRTHQRG